MNIDPHKSIKEIFQEYFDDGFNKGIEVGKRMALESIQPSTTFYDNLSMSTLPPYVQVRLDKKAEVCFEFDPKTFRHYIAVQSFQNIKNKKYALYSSANITREEMPDFLKYFLTNILKKDYYDNYIHTTKENYMKGIF